MGCFKTGLMGKAWRQAKAKVSASRQKFSAERRIYRAHRDERADRASGGTFKKCLRSNLAPMPG